MIDCNFEMEMPFWMKNNIVSEIEEYIRNFNGKFHYVEKGGLINKKIKFFISVENKYYNDILYMCKQLMEYVNSQV